MNFVHRLFLGTASVIGGVSLILGCSAGDKLYGGNSPPGSPPAVKNAIDVCVSTARSCLEDATNAESAGACADDLHACTQEALQPVEEIAKALRACRDAASACVSDASTKDAGAACAATARDCVLAALPPPPPCIQTLQTCVTQEGADKEQCLDDARTCIRDTLTPDAGTADGG
jgi:hypothetical protein